MKNSEEKPEECDATEVQSMDERRVHKKEFIGNLINKYKYTNN